LDHSTILPRCVPRKPVANPLNASTTLTTTATGFGFPAVPSIETSLLQCGKKKKKELPVHKWAFKQVKHMHVNTPRKKKLGVREAVEHKYTFASHVQRRSTGSTTGR
jgi:hypothetical protein